MEKVGKIFNIQPFSTTDGPGIRTVIFFQGCNLRCLWCHNPESIPINPEIRFIEENCIGCGGCAEERHPRHCFAKALVDPVRKMTGMQLWDMIKEDTSYFKKSGGGITFSGGECMLQYEFLQEMTKICRQNNVHVAVDTAGHVPYEWLKQVDPDLFLYDIKAYSEQLSKTLVGVNGKLIWENLEKLVNDGFKVHVRIPCIPGANWEEIPLIIRKLKAMGIEKIQLLPYHNLGVDKMKHYSKEVFHYTPPTDEQMNELKELL